MRVEIQRALQPSAGTAMCVTSTRKLVEFDSSARVRRGRDPHEGARENAGSNGLATKSGEGEARYVAHPDRSVHAATNDTAMRFTLNELAISMPRIFGSGNSNSKHAALPAARGEEQSRRVGR